MEKAEDKIFIIDGDDFICVFIDLFILKAWALKENRLACFVVPWNWRLWRRFLLSGWTEPSNFN